MRVWREKSNDLLFPLFFLFFFLASPRRTNKFRSKSAKSNAKWAAKLSDDDECCTMLCTLYAVYYRRSHRYESLTQTQPPSLPCDCAAAALPMVTQFRCTSAAVNELSWVVGTYFIWLFRGGGGRGALVCAKFRFRFHFLRYFRVFAIQKRKTENHINANKMAPITGEEIMKAGEM